jgi:hypothetical protein
MSATIASVIRLTVSLLTVVSSISSRCRWISPVVSPDAYSEITWPSSPSRAAGPVWHQLRVEGPVAIPRHPDRHLTDLGRHRLCERPVAGVARAPALQGGRLKAEVFGQLGLQTRLEHPRHQRRQQAAGTGQRNALGPGLLDQVASDLVERVDANELGRRSRHGRPGV